MTTVLVRHKVEDYAKWKSEYDTLDSFHKTHGVRSAQILRGTDNPNELVVISEFDDAATARAFVQSDELKQIMQRAGVADKPDIYFLDKAASRSFA
ncbi:MAG: antibiotic biosynthesis monooxygenase [Thaumarchaeota archaeon]|nr:antibiotic biosynthesis monooxygenase [Nitrososphaerota archaeon]